MIVTYKQIHLINFPIFKLPSNDVMVVDGLLYCGSGLVDDRNQIGTNLGQRRLQTPHELMNLGRAFPDITSLLSGKHNHFIDYKGYCFTYSRTLFCNIMYKKIMKVIGKETHTVLKVQDCPFPIVVKRPPPSGMPWVGLIYIRKRPWLPYEYSDRYCTMRKRKI